MFLVHIYTIYYTQDSVPITGRPTRGTTHSSPLEAFCSSGILQLLFCWSKALSYSIRKGSGWNVVAEYGVVLANAPKKYVRCTVGDAMLVHMRISCVACFGREILKPRRREQRDMRLLRAFSQRHGFS